MKKNGQIAINGNTETVDCSGYTSDKCAKIKDDDKKQEDKKDKDSKGGAINLQFNFTFLTIVILTIFKLH